MEVEIRRASYNNNIFYEYSYLNKIKHGVQKKYYNKQLVWMWHMKNGQQHGIVQDFKLDGTRHCFEQWRDNRFNGLDIRFKYEN